MTFAIMPQLLAFFLHICLYNYLATPSRSPIAAEFKSP